MRSHVYLQPYGVFLLPLHVIDVPGHRRHGDDGVLDDLVAGVALVKVFGKLLRTDGKSVAFTAITAISPLIFFT